MTKVIIPTDFSENAKHALTQSIDFFREESCEFFIIHAYADEVYDNNAYLARALFNDIKEKAKAASNEKLMAVLEYAQDTTPSPKHHFRIRSIFQSLIDAIDDMVNQEGADIVVMGTKGATNAPGITFGSNTLQVIRHVESPVLVIPESYVFNRPKNILFPTNFMIPYNRRELKLLNYMGMDFRATIHLLIQATSKKLTNRKQDNKQLIQEMLHSCKQELHFESGTGLVETINNFIEVHHIDLLVMVNSHQSYLDDMLHKTTIDKIGLTTKIPFLVLQNIDRCSC
ncbi:universal stress protein [Aquimarina agarivorans]|uniref:universal stress protein n=1 Tax=Aquimarina agarivorans TaxID=980584 RepID=UPI000248EBB4|nr:universal stress protein [Aquimarina agarivorans]